MFSRSSALGDSDLAQAMTAVAEDFDSVDAKGDLATFKLVVEGTVKPLNPTFQDEIYRIVREAMRDAFSHSGAHHIEAEIAYGETLLRVRIRDDGTGIDPSILSQGERAGHFGLTGMRERAQRVGARLEVWSEHRAGTEIELSVPGSVAYGTSPGAAGYRLFRKKAASR
jgi:signal transduction histidine kinase